MCGLPVGAPTRPGPARSARRRTSKHTGARRRLVLSYGGDVTAGFAGGPVVGVRRGFSEGNNVRGGGGGGVKEGGGRGGEASPFRGDGLESALAAWATGCTGAPINADNIATVLLPRHSDRRARAEGPLA